MFVSAIFVYICIGLIAADDKQPSVDKVHPTSKILNDLLTSYDHRLKPDGVLTVHVSGYVSFATWEQNEATFDLYLRQKWYDPRLVVKDEITFNEEDIHIWKPDTFYPNMIRQTILDKGFVRINNGNITWSHRLKLKVPCVANFDLLRMDDGKINCTIELESYSFSETNIKYQWLSDRAITVDAYNSPIVTGFETGSSSTALSTGTYSRLKVNFEMQTPFRKQVLEFLTRRLFKQEF